MGIVMFVSGAVTASLIWALFVKLMGASRDEYRKTVERKDSVIKNYQCKDAYRAGFRRAERQSADELIDSIQQNAVLLERVSELQKKLDELRGMSIATCMAEVSHE